MPPEDDIIENSDTELVDYELGAEEEDTGYHHDEDDATEVDGTEGESRDEDDATEVDGTEGEAEGDDDLPGENTDPKGYTKRIHKKHSELMAERERADGLQRQLDSLQAKQDVATRPEIPPLPDPFDENYAGLMEQRDLAIQGAVAYDAQQNFINEQRQANERSAREAEVTRLNETVASYTERSEKLGISKAQLKLAGQTVQAQGISDEVVAFILEEEKGPAITHFLARNPDELDKINNLPPMKAAAYISSTIIPKVGVAKGRKRPPKPASTLSGKGVTRRERGPEGVTYT